MCKPAISRLTAEATPARTRAYAPVQEALLGVTGFSQLSVTLVSVLGFTTIAAVHGFTQLGAEIVTELMALLSGKLMYQARNTAVVTVTEKIIVKQE